MSEDKKSKIRRTKEGGVLSPGRPRKKQTEEPKTPAKRGRPKGTTSVTRKMTRNNVQVFLNKNYDAAVKAWEEIEDPYQKFKAYMEMMNYVYPKMRSVEFTAEEGTSSLEAKMLVMINKSIKEENEKDVEDVSHEDIL